MIQVALGFTVDLIKSLSFIVVSMISNCRDCFYDSLTFLSLCVLAVFTFGCGQSVDVPRNEYPVSTDARVVDCEPGQYGGMFVLSTPSAPLTFNYLGASSLGTHSVLNKLMGALLEYDPVEQVYTPGLATSWTVDSSKLRYTFKLREAVFWSDGTPFTVDDVIFTFDVIAAQKLDEASGKRLPMYVKL